MIIGHIVGNITSVAKVKELRPAKIYLAQIQDFNIKSTKRFEAVIDSVGVGIGDYVLISMGSAARMPKLISGMPSDATVVARIDNIEDLRI